MEQEQVSSKGSVISAMFLVAGTCIGGGMLALPVATGINGFLPSLVVMIACWLGMTVSALLLLEASLWMEEGVHVITMAKRLLGPVGQAVSWLLFLFISYASLVAYTAGGGVQVAAALKAYAGTPVSNDVGATIFLLVFGVVLFLGTIIVGRVNAILFLALVGAYFVLVGMGIDEVKPELLTKYRWSGSLLAIPLLLTSFSFQTMVPSLTPYLKGHANQLRLAIVGGTTLTFVVYAIWQCLILGIVPADGPNGLTEAFIRGEPATQFLREHVGGKWICTVAEYFAFFAIVTSFLGIGLGLYDFLADGLKIKKTGAGHWILGALIAIPTLFFGTQFERVFLLALDFTGGFGDTILNGIIPVLMVWIGRYHLGYKHSFVVPGGKPLLVATAVFFTFCLALEIGVTTGIVPSMHEHIEIIEIHNPEQVDGGTHESETCL